MTALAAAGARAAHLIVDNTPHIFTDTLAHTLLGDQAEEYVGYHLTAGDHVVLVGTRSGVVVRSRYTERRLAEAVRRGVAQYVILGSGLDSFGYRSGLADGIRVFEVDHPATQEWKRSRLRAAGIAVPENVVLVPVDFESESSADRLIGAGFELSRPAFVSWLGVTMYLTKEAIGQVLAMVGDFACDTEIVVEHMVPAELRDAAAAEIFALVAPVIADRGEPWRTFLSPREMSALFAENGLEAIEQVGQRDAVEATLWNRTDSLRPIESSMIGRARRRGADAGPRPAA